MNLKWPPPSFLWQPTKRPQLINIFERMTKRDKDKDMANTKTKTTKNNIGLHCCWPFLYAYISNPNNGTTTNGDDEDDTYNGAPIVLAMAEPLGRRWFFAWTVPTHQHHQHICRRFTGLSLLWSIPIVRNISGNVKFWIPQVARVIPSYPVTFLCVTKLGALAEG